MIWLASASPRRRELLKLLGVEFDVVTPDIDESVLPNEAPGDYVMRMAKEKGRAAGRMLSAAAVILSADTSVIRGGVILGKPEDEADAVTMLNELQNATHQVLTAVVLTRGDRQSEALSVSEVDFGPMTEEEISAYWQTGEPADKAGSYGIQGIGGQFIKEIRGSYTGIVGLPLYETRMLLKQWRLL